MKNIKIVICDDEPNYIATTKELLEEHFSAEGYAVDITTFTDGDSCLNYLECHQVDLLFLDIFLGQEDLGTNLALKMRAHNKNTKLVFLSTSNEFATESFNAQASYYLLKPLTPEKLTAALERCDLTPKQNLATIDTGREEITLDRDKVIAIEVQNKYTFIHTTAGVLKELCPLSRFQEQFQEPDFLSIHRSFIINLHHVKRLEGDFFVMSDGFQAPIKTRGTKAIKDYYMQWLFKHM